LIEECNTAFALSCAEDIDCSVDPSTYNEAMVSNDRDKWVFAMQEQMQSLEKNGTRDIVRLLKKRSPFVANGSSKERRVHLQVSIQG
jgi:hypothetical protein